MSYIDLWIDSRVFLEYITIKILRLLHAAQAILFSQLLSHKHTANESMPLFCNDYFYSVFSLFLPTAQKIQRAHVQLRGSRSFGRAFAATRL